MVAQPLVARRTLQLLPRWLITLLLAIVWALPIAWMVVISLKPENQIVTTPIRWFPEHLSDFTLQNYINVLAIPRGVDLIRSFLNNLTVATVGTASVVVVDTLAAYALARLHFRGRTCGGHPRTGPCTCTRRTWARPHCRSRSTPTHRCRMARPA